MQIEKAVTRHLFVNTCHYIAKDVTDVTDVMVFVPSTRGIYFHS